MDFNKESLELHKKHKGKMGVLVKVPLKTKDDLSLAYTPGVAEPCRVIAQDPDEAYQYTPKGNTVAIISDGSAVLGLGNIGAQAAYPVMEGKAILFKTFADIDAVPLCINEQDPDKLIEIIKSLAPNFGGINLEDISSPRCILIEEALQDLGIPVFHDDQHGTAIVVLAAMINALKVTSKSISDLKVVISGAGSAGLAIAKILNNYAREQGTNYRDMLVCDSKGIVSDKRTDLNFAKTLIAKVTNVHGVDGDLKTALDGADVFIGVSQGNILTAELIISMNDAPIIFAMANPIPEIMPDIAKEAGAAVVGTGRSDFPNQINNVLAFPGIFRGALDIRAPRITEQMKLAAAKALAGMVDPTAQKILPDPLDEGVAARVAEAVKAAS